jgi:thiol-disulfide isomerase/thioredoxin
VRALLLAAALGALAGCVSASPLRVGGPMDLELRTLGGSPFSFEVAKGKVLLVDVWASWCGPCRASMPFYADLATAWKDRGFEFVGVNIDEDPRAAKAFLERAGLELRTLRDPGAELIAPRLNVTRMPTAFFVDRTGRIRGTHEGFVERDKALIRETLEALLAEPAPD